MEQKNTKEGFLEIASNSLTQRGCQDYCEIKKIVSIQLVQRIIVGAFAK